MLGNNQSVTNEKPQGLAVTKPQGETMKQSSGNSNTHLTESKSRHDKGMELYKAGRVQLTPSGMFKVSERFYVDVEQMRCDCPDYRARKEPCKHVYAACLFVKNRGKEKVEPIDGKGDWLTEMMNDPAYDKPKQEPKDAPNKPLEPQKQLDSKPFDRQSTITRLAVLNTATEILKTHGKPITSEALFKVAAELEKWALGI